MKVLYVVGTDLSRNTSANISHNAYVQGLLENGCQVDILMSSSSWGEADAAMPIWREASYYIYNSVSFIDKVKTIYKNKIDRQNTTAEKGAESQEVVFDKITPGNSFKKSIRNGIKKIYDVLFNTSNIYNLDRTWLRNARKFKETSPYDLIISNSSPASSHRLVLELLSLNHITETRWIQIWEDPWFFDIYGTHPKKLKKEEHRLLQAAKEIFYVSILTLQYQKIHFSDCAHKMKHLPLPYLKLSENKTAKVLDKIQLGYFGDFYSKTRNLRPFYDAVIECGATAYINGDTDLLLKSTLSVKVEGRITLDRLVQLQNQTNVLVHLCNLSGGQIPGKIYHYSATTKPILFILDGTTEEKKIIKEYFMKFNRYYFCENNKDDILEALNKFINGKENLEKSPILEFAPRQVIAELLSN